MVDQNNWSMITTPLNLLENKNAVYFFNPEDFAKLNTEELPDLAAEFGIQSIPCLIITKEGKEVDRIIGFAPGPVMKQKIDQILSQL